MSRSHKILLILVFLLGGVGVFSLSYGLPKEVSVVRGMKDLIFNHDSVSALIIGQLRLPRLILAFLIGSALGLSGANLQAVMRNPLADPGILGITGWASLGAVIVFYTGLVPASSLIMTFASFGGAFLASIVLFLLSRGGLMIMTLTGIALSTVSVALLSLILNLVPSPYARYEMMHWLMGSLNQVDLNDVLIASPGLIIGCIFLMKTRHSLDGLALGDDVAFTMGINPYHVHLLIIAGTALSLGSAVAIAGNIAFIGLIVPHIIRYLVGFRPSDSLLPSALLGGVLLVGADMIVRFPVMGADLPLGVVTTLIGTPCFLFQIWKLHSRNVQ